MSVPCGCSPVVPFPTAASAPCPSRWRRFARRLAALARGWQHWTRDCHELRLLLAMPNDQLIRDMGASRYDLRMELYRPFWDWARAQEEER